ncbi:hypothetical protein FF1_017342 [Malus domestica]
MGLEGPDAGIREATGKVGDRSGSASAKQQRKFFVSANWKCNGTFDEVKKIVNILNKGQVPSQDVVEFVVSPPNSKRHVRGSGPICSCNTPLGILYEQNRSPRASKPKSQIMADSSVENTKHNASTNKVLDESFNRTDFVTEYKDAKFFIIKSYSEDNVHKSIKYGVWASTPNCNKKLEAAYREAKEMHDSCPIFPLLFGEC